MGTCAECFGEDPSCSHHWPLRRRPSILGKLELPVNIFADCDPDHLHRVHLQKLLEIFLLLEVQLRVFKQHGAKG